MKGKKEKLSGAKVRKAGKEFKARKAETRKPGCGPAAFDTGNTMLGYSLFCPIV